MGRGGGGARINPVASKGPPPPPPRSIPVPKPRCCVVGGEWGAGGGLGGAAAVRRGRAVAAEIRRDAAVLGRGGWNLERGGCGLEMGGVGGGGRQKGGGPLRGATPKPVGILGLFVSPCAALSSLPRSTPGGWGGGSLEPPREVAVRSGASPHPGEEGGPCSHGSIPVDMGDMGWSLGGL